MKIKRIIFTVIATILLAQGSLAFSDEPAKDNSESNNSIEQLIQKVEEQIFYAERQKGLDSADYTLIWSTPFLMRGVLPKLQYGNKKNAKGTESDSFSPKSDKKKEVQKNDKSKPDKSADEARTWPDYKAQMGLWNLTDPANLLMQIFIVPLHRTFPDDKWTYEGANTEDGGYLLAFTSKIARPTPTNPFDLNVNSITLEIDKDFVVRKIRMQFADDPKMGDIMGKRDVPYMKLINESVTQVKFDKYKDKLLIKELAQEITAGSQNVSAPFFKMHLTPVYTFEFKEFSGFLLPTVKDLALYAGQLSGTLADQELHLLVEYLDYKVAKKSLFRPETGKDILWIETQGFSVSDEMAVNIQPSTLPQETLNEFARHWAAGWWQNLITETVTYIYSGSGGIVTFTAQYPGNNFPLTDQPISPDIYANIRHFTGEGSGHYLLLSYNYVPEVPVPVKPNAQMKAARIALYPKDSWIDNAVITGFKRVSEYVLWDYTVNTGYKYLDKWVHWWKFKLTIDIGFKNDLTIKDEGVVEIILKDKGDGAGPTNPPKTSTPLAKDYVKDPQKHGWEYSITIKKK